MTAAAQSWAPPSHNAPPAAAASEAPLRRVFIAFFASANRAPAASQLVHVAPPTASEHLHVPLSSDVIAADETPAPVSKAMPPPSWLPARAHARVSEAHPMLPAIGCAHAARRRRPRAK